jgi:hypothetical protein
VTAKLANKKPRKAARPVKPACEIDPTLVPELMNQDNTPGDTTLYLKINLGLSRQEPKTAVYIPDRRKIGAHLDVILYLHGFKPNNVGKGADIERLLKARRRRANLWYPLREAISEADKKSFVFVAPTLGDFSQGGCLIDRNSGAGQPSQYLQQVMLGLEKHLSLNQRPQLGRIVLAAHSGGGVLLRQLAKHPDIRRKVREAWCFDCLYSGSTDSEFWSQWSHRKPSSIEELFMWANGQPHHRLFIHTTGANRKGSDTLAETKAVQKRTKGLANVRFEMMPRGVDHNASPGRWIKELIMASVLT